MRGYTSQMEHNNNPRHATTKRFHIHLTPCVYMIVIYLIRFLFGIQPSLGKRMIFEMHHKVPLTSVTKCDKIRLYMLQCSESPVDKDLLCI